MTDPATPTIDAEFYTAQQVAVRDAANRVQAAWAQLDPADPASLAGQVQPAVVAAIEEAQAQASAPAALYVAGALLAAGAVSAPLATLVTAAFVGAAASGLLLGVLADYGLRHYQRALAAGMPPSEARAIGLSRLLTYTATEVADTGRAAVQVAMIAEPAVAGYERIVRLPACGRCLILAGRLYRYSDGFARHPRCDCLMRPVTRDQWENTNPGNTPAALFARMSRAQQDKAFGAGDAEAIRAGADMARVVNVHRGVTVAGARRQSGRPTAAQLVTASTDRADLLAELQRFGYLR
ncbi:MAG TPA: hypothetical protein VM677_35400 [Actinokineospora sp.]|nr:hypothetical protein [Actinokineospora sp.]